MTITEWDMSSQRNSFWNLHHQQPCSSYDQASHRRWCFFQRSGVVLCLFSCSDIWFAPSEQDRPSGIMIREHSVKQPSSNGSAWYKPTSYSVLYPTLISSSWSPTMKLPLFMFVSFSMLKCLRDQIYGRGENETLSNRDGRYPSTVLQTDSASRIPAITRYPTA